jgi:homoserine kinase
MSDKGSSDTAKLVVTAVGAAIAGAAVGAGVMNILNKKTCRKKKTETLYYHVPNQSTSILLSEADNKEESQRLLMPHQHEERMRRKIAARAHIEEENFVPRDSVTVRVPATSANMGPGCE